MEPTHASFFSGVGGLDLGLERAGWRTVSFSEIDPYASAVLAERWTGVPNLGDVVRMAAGQSGYSPDQRHGTADGESDASDPWHAATLWTGGFPCQDLSVAGKRRGMGSVDDRTRSGLAYAFLDLVERHRPPAILLENVPGLLSSNGGKDLGALLGRLGELGYWWAYRILDAQFFGVPQRRRRVFICALHAGAGFGADSPAAVLSVGARCEGHSAASDEARTGVASGVESGVDIAGSLTSAMQSAGRNGQDDHNNLLVPVLRSSPDSGGVREADGLAGRLDDLAPTLRVGPQRPQDGGPGDTVPITLSQTTERDAARLELDPDPLPLGLDSHRYRCCGNGVVAPVSEWIGHRLRWAVEGMKVAA